MRGLVLGGVLALAACAGGDRPEVAAGGSESGAPLSKCADVDWASLGQRDGLYGETPDRLSLRATECAGALTASNAQDYHRGRARGLLAYCTPDAGYDAGRNGRDYRGVCAPETEGAFLAEYRKGRGLFDLTDGLAQKRAALTAARASLASDRFEIRRELERIADMNTGADDKGEAIESVARYRQSISRLEDEIPRLESAIAEAEAALKARNIPGRE